MKVRVLTQPTGLINGVPWPEPGGVFELHDGVAESMVEAGWVEKVEEKPKVETRPSKAKAETRTG